MAPITLPPVTLPPAPEAATVAVLRAIAEPARLRMVEALASEDLCVCHLVEDLGMPQPLVSHHLRVLRDAGIVTSERYRYWTYYRLEREVVAALADRLAHLASPPSGSPSSGEPAARRPCC